jgi:hypothetical protein
MSERGSWHVRGRPDCSHRGLDLVVGGPLADANRRARRDGNGRGTLPLAFRRVQARGPQVARSFAQ